MLDKFVVGGQYRANPHGRSVLLSTGIALPVSGVVTCHSIDTWGMWTFDATFLGNTPPKRGVYVGDAALWEEA